MYQIRRVFILVFTVPYQLANMHKLIIPIFINIPMIVINGLFIIRLNLKPHNSIIIITKGKEIIEIVPKDIKIKPKIKPILKNEHNKNNIAIANSIYPNSAIQLHEFKLLTLFQNSFI